MRDVGRICALLMALGVACVGQSEVFPVQSLTTLIPRAGGWPSDAAAVWTGDLMQAKNTYIAVSLLLTCCLALSLASCQSFSWHLAASKKGDTVELCLSNGDVCPQPGGVSPSSISVYRWDNMHDNELVWDAEPENPITEGNISGMLTYGAPPKDWINKLAPPALVCGKAYLFNPGAHYFALQCDGSVVVFDDPHLEEFFSGKMHPQNRTK